MQFVALNGARVPKLGLGTWPLRGWIGRRAIARAIALGYRHIDTAQIYENEADVGRAIRSSRIPREEFFVTTKLAQGNLAAAAVRRTGEESLRRLGMDYVDLLLIHWPSDVVALGETLGAMAELRGEGKARFLGVSNFDSPRLTEAVERHGADLLCNQIEFHPFLSQRSALATARRYRMMVTAYSPVARGRVNEDMTIRKIAAKHHKTPAQIALRWLIEQESVAAIPKAGSGAHAAENLAIFDFTLDAEDRAEIGGLASPQGRLQPLPSGVHNEP